MDPTTKTRTKTALIAAGMVFLVLFWGGMIGMFILAEVLLLMGTWELLLICYNSPEERKRNIIYCSLAGIYFPILLMNTRTTGVDDLTTGLLCICIISTYGISSGMLLAPPTEESKEIVKLVSPVIHLSWLNIGLMGMCMIRSVAQGFEWLWFLLCTVWLTDIGAYFCGRAWEKKKMAPTISPGKTLVGTFCGVVTATLGGTLYGYFVGLNVSLAILLRLSVMVSILAVISDLYESLIKRTFSVKDSGTLLPGHGGVLDRLDSLLYASPILAHTLLLIN